LIGTVNTAIKRLLNLIIIQHLAAYTVLWKCQFGGL